MTKAEMKEMILSAKKEKGLSWAQLGEIAGAHEVYVASCCHGENSMAPESAQKVCESLGLGPEIAACLAEFPMKGWSMSKVVPTDPLIYRFYEIMAVYGTTMKDVIQEKFGDGIMSAIDFKLDVRRESDPKGDRVVVVMDGKFLPYKKW